MQVKRPITYVLLFLAVVLAGDWGLSYLFDAALYRSHSRFSRLYDGRAAADIVVIGNSRGFHSFHAPTMEKALGEEVINLSYNALPSELSYVILSDYLEHNRKPRLLILEVSNVRMSPDVITELKPYTNRSEGLSRVLEREQPTAFRAAQVSHLFRLNGEQFFQNLRYLKGDDQGRIHRGVMTQAVIDTVAEMDEAPFLENMNFPPGLTDEERAQKRADYIEWNMDGLRKSVAKAQAEGIEVRLVLAPYYVPYRAKISDWASIVADIQQAAGDVPIWDYSLALGDPNELADRVHPNLTGAVKLLEIMQRDRFFEANAIPAR
jgi:hypothetical protein